MRPRLEFLVAGSLFVAYLLGLGCSSRQSDPAHGTASQGSPSAAVTSSGSSTEQKRDPSSSERAIADIRELGGSVERDEKDRA
jgi:hypothetical protein